MLTSTQAPNTNTPTLTTDAVRTHYAMVEDMMRASKHKHYKQLLYFALLRGLHANSTRSNEHTGGQVTLSDM